MRQQRAALRMAARLAGPILAASLLPGCGNSPYPLADGQKSILYTSFSQDPGTLDPSIAYDLNDESLTNLLYSSYYQYHYLKREPFVLEPALGAEEARRRDCLLPGSAGTRRGERWTFRIKRGLRYQDDPCFPGGKGREIFAKDFLNAFRRMADPRVACPIYAFFGDRIVGLARYRDQLQAASPDRQNSAALLDAPILGLQVEPGDPYTFHILLNQPYPQLRFLMAMPFTAPLPEEALSRYADERVPKSAPDTEKLSRHPVGCGPYRLAEYIRQSRVVLKANPNYRAETYPSEGERGDREAGLLDDAGKRLPLTDTIQVNIIREGVTGFNQFLQGYLDSAGIGQTEFQHAMSQPGTLSPEMARRGIRLAHAVKLEAFTFGFNMRDPTVGGFSERNRKLRQAISLSIDARELIDLQYLGLGVPGESLVCPGLFGYEAAYRNPYRQFDPTLTRAGKLLAEAGYPNGIDPATGKPLALSWDNDGTSSAGRQFNGLVTRQIERLGVRLESHSFLSPELTDRIQKGQCQIMNGLWGADYPDPENFVFLLYGPNSAVVSHGPNYGNYDNPEYSHLFEQMRAMEDGPERLEIIRKMRAIAQEDCPVIPYRHTEVYGLIQPWMHNFKPHPIALDGRKYLRIDAAERARLRAEWNRPNYLPAVVFVGLLMLAVLPATHVVNARLNRRTRVGPS